MAEISLLKGLKWATKAAFLRQMRRHRQPALLRARKCLATVLSHQESEFLPLLSSAAGCADKAAPNKIKDLPAAVGYFVAGILQLKETAILTSACGSMTRRLG